jgi:hypothetical protein
MVGTRSGATPPLGGGRSLLARPALHVWKPFQAFYAYSCLFCALIHVEWPCNASRAEEPPYHITRAGNAFQICILERVPGEAHSKR